MPDTFSDKRFHDESFEETLNGWMSDVEKAVKLTEAEQLEITKAGADVYANILQKNTKKEHYDLIHHKNSETYTTRGGNEITKEIPHLADTVKSAPASDGSPSYEAGFSTKGKRAYIAKFLNDGTKKLPADHFVDRARQEAIPKVILAQQAVYNRIMEGRQA